MFLARLTSLLEAALTELRAAVVHFATLERYVTADITLNRETAEFLRHEMTEAKMGLATSTTARRELQIRLAAAERDFEWARLRINQLEHERADLLARLLDTVPTGGPPMHFQVPTIEPKREGRPTEPPTGGLAAVAGTPLGTDAARIAALVNANIFADERGEDDVEAPPRPS